MSYASILKKILMAVTGLGWFAFVIVHLAGNLLILQGPEDFNAYAAFLEGTGELLYLAEASLIALLLVHVWMASKVTLENRKARKGRYAVNQTNGEASVASRTMAVAGIILLAFIITHVKMFKFGDRSGGEGLWGLVVRTFQDPLMVGWYVLAMLALGLHLSHGFGSALQTLGVVRPSLRVKFKRLGYTLGWIVALGFAGLPLYAFLFMNA